MVIVVHYSAEDSHNPLETLSKSQTDFASKLPRRYQTLLESYIFCRIDCPKHNASVSQKSHCYKGTFVFRKPLRYSQLAFILMTREWTRVQRYSLTTHIRDFIMWAQFSSDVVGSVTKCVDKILQSPPPPTQEQHSHKQQNIHTLKKLPVTNSTIASSGPVRTVREALTIETEAVVSLIHKQDLINENDDAGSSTTKSQSSHMSDSKKYLQEIHDLRQHRETPLSHCGSSQANLLIQQCYSNEQIVSLAPLPKPVAKKTHKIGDSHLFHPMTRQAYRARIATADPSLGQ